MENLNGCRLFDHRYEDASYHRSLRVYSLLQQSLERDRPDEPDPGRVSIHVKGYPAGHCFAPGDHRADAHCGRRIGLRPYGGGRLG